MTAIAPLRQRALPGAAGFCPDFEIRSNRISQKVVGAERRVL
jgi:hypothetical protein